MRVLFLELESTYIGQDKPPNPCGQDDNPSMIRTQVHLHRVRVYDQAPQTLEAELTTTL